MLKHDNNILPLNSSNSDLNSEYIEFLINHKNLFTTHSLEMIEVYLD